MRRFRVDRVHLENIGAFESLDLKLISPFKRKDAAEIHILTGENGTGKSTILQAIASIEKYNSIAKKVQKSSSNALVGIDFTYDEGLAEDGRIIGSAVVHSEYKLANGNWNKIGSSINSEIEQYIRKIHQYTTSRFDFAMFAYSGHRNVYSTKIQAIKELEGNPLENALNFDQSVNPNLLLQWIANTKTKEALAFTRGDIAKANMHNFAINRVENVIQAITGWKVKFNLADNPLSVEININGIDLDFSVLPDGLKSIISWVADLLMRIDRIPWKLSDSPFNRNFILLLDEIEVHLHPAWQRKVLPIIQKLFPNAQIIISTHSPFVTNSVDGAWIYRLKKEGTNSVLDGEPVLSENGKSYRTVLEEIFGIDKEFGEEVEKDLERFNQLKAKIIANELEFADPSFLELARSLSVQSVELESIIGMELKQISRIKKVPLVTL